MIRSASFRRPMARLALFALLLLALVPTLGRLAHARHAGFGAAPAWAALCTSRGLAAVLLPANAHAAEHGADGAPSSPHGAGDCDYCPLLAASVPVAFVRLAVPPLAAAPALCTSRPLPTRESPHPCGLGSRGPPAFS